jgi:putative transposase
MRKAFKYRVYPTKPQVAELEQTLRLCRELYNAALEERIVAYRKCGVTLTGYDQKRSLPEIKDARPEYKRIHSQVLQDVILRLDKAFKAFFARVKRGDTPGFPRFQGRNRFDSFTFPQAANTGVRLLENGRIAIHGIGGSLKVKWHRALEGRVKTATFKREGRHWYIVFSVEYDNTPLPMTDSSVGIDLGLNHFVVTSDGEFVDAPRLLRAAQKKLRVAQRSLSRKKRGSKRRGKQRERVAKLHAKITNQRKDFHHKVARRLVNDHQLIAVEDLNVKGLARTRLAKSVHDAGWSTFLGILDAKAEDAGRQVVRVDPKYTSQDCSVCGYREKHGLSVREFTCRGCGVSHNRDRNAAKNILLRAGALPSNANVTAIQGARSLRSPAF